MMGRMLMVFPPLQVKHQQQPINYPPSVFEALLIFKFKVQVILEQNVLLLL